MTDKTEDKTEKKCECTFHKFWTALFALTIILSAVYCTVALHKHFSQDQEWEAINTVFAFLGFLLTAGAAVPAISAILSYQGFVRQSENANTQLANLKEKLASYEKILSKFEEKEQLLDKYFSYAKNYERIKKAAFPNNSNGMDIENSDEWDYLKYSINDEKEKSLIIELASLNIKIQEIEKYNRNEDGDLSAGDEIEIIKISCQKTYALEKLAAINNQYQDEFIRLLCDNLLELNHINNRDEDLEKYFTQFKALFEKMPIQRIILLSIPQYERVKQQMFNK